MAAPELAIKSLPASSGRSFRSQKHFALQQVECIRKTSLSETFMPQFWVTRLCSAYGSLSRSTTVASLQCLLVVLVSSALVSLFSSKLQILGTGWASFNHSALRFLKAEPERVHVVFRKVWDRLSLL